MPAAITAKWLSACIEQGARRRDHPRQRVPDGARGNRDQATGPLLRQPLRRRPRLGHGRRARRQARLARQDRDLRGRRRRLHVRQPDARCTTCRRRCGCRCFSSSPTTRAGRRCTARRCPFTRKGSAAETKQPPFATLEPSPRFEHVVQASGGYGERVTEPSKLMPALERALKVVKEEKRQARAERLPRSELRQDQLGIHGSRASLRFRAKASRDARRADAPDDRQLDARGADAEVEAEQVELEAVDPACRHAEAGRAARTGSPCRSARWRPMLVPR